MFRDYDCWGFVRDFYKNELNTDLPFICIDSGNLRAVAKEFIQNETHNLFERVTTPQNFDIVLMGRTRINHCGIILKDGDTIRVLHNREHQGVICETVETVERRTNLLSFHRLKNG